MSIQSELQTLIQNKADIKAAIETKLSSSISDNMSTWDDEIMSIPSGSIGSLDEKNVKFIDYEGTILYSYTVEEANALTELPPLPSHEGLICQGWNYTLAQMKTYVNDIDGCVIGAIYTTSDGKTKINITLNSKEYTNIVFRYNQSVSNGVEVDWGDGSSASFSSETGLITINHQYFPGSYPTSYIVSFNVVSGTMSFSASITGYSNNSITVARDAWNSMINSINIGNNVTSVGNYAFQYCYGLNSITIPSTITSIGSYAFQYCHSLQSITIPSGITSILSRAFYYCYSLQHVSIPWSVTNIGTYAFSRCYSLQEINLPRITSTTDNSFSYCYSLKRLIIPPTVTYIAIQSFQNNYSLAYVFIPSSVTSIGTTVFQYCSSLKRVTLSSRVTSIGGKTFYYCYSLQEIDIPSTITTINSSLFEYCCSLKHITIPSTVTSIGANAFNNCYSLQKLIIPSIVTSIGSNGISYCSSLQSISIPSGISNITAQLFIGCYGIQIFDFSEYTSVPSLANVNAFTNTPSTKKIVVPDALYDDWIAATNWNSSTNQIKESIIKKSDFDNL